MIKGYKINDVLRITSPLVLFCFLLCPKLHAQYNINIIKAAYIERITRFVEWPLKDSLSSRDKFVIGVFAETEFFNTLIDVFKAKQIKDHSVTIIPINSPEEINMCNLCYISGKAKPSVNKFVAAANSSGVLLISGTTDFSKAGVHINFYIEDEKLKFEINEQSVISAGFKVSYLLMQNTRIIR
jgi:hypothetical protein